MLIDSHCHLDLVLKKTIQTKTQLLAECAALNIKPIIIPGLTFDQWPQIAQLCEQTPELYFAVGLHPWWIKEWVNEWLAKQSNKPADAAKQLTQRLAMEIPQWVDHPKCIGIGECGLDGYIDTPLDIQLEVMAQHMQLAQTHHKPLLIHSCKMHHHLLQLLKQYPLPAGGTLHAYTGHYETAQALIKHGLYLGIGGSITYPRAQKTRQTVCKIPLSKLVLETDAPDMPLNGFQGQINTPMQLPQVASYLAKLRQEAIEQIQQVTSANALRLFGLT